MPKRFALSTNVSGAEMWRPACSLILIIFLIYAAGCTGAPAGSSWSADKNGVLSLSCAPVTTSEKLLWSNGTFTKSRVIMHTRDGDVFAYLAAPENPRAAVVYVPGAGERLSGHEERMGRYATAGYVFLFLDMRGGGGETTGLPFSPQLLERDYAAFSRGEWPQYYESVCDLSSARRVLSESYHVPVYVMGSSNGGRYAAVAAGTDPAFAGFVGISMSDWGIYETFVQQGYSGDTLRFAVSIEPSTYIRKISPRPVWIFHSRDDPVIPFASGKALADHAGNSAQFAEFDGSHRINDDVDARILTVWAQIYGTQG